MHCGNPTKFWVTAEPTSLQAPPFYCSRRRTSWSTVWSNSGQCLELLQRPWSVR